SVYEADDIIPRIAYDLCAPILSTDSDFLIQNLPAGVISVKSVIANDFKVTNDSTTGRKYLACQLFKVEGLQQKFPGLKSELVPLGGAILGIWSCLFGSQTNQSILSNTGNDYLDFKESNRIISKLPTSENHQCQKYRQFQIHTVFT